MVSKSFADNHKDDLAKIETCIKKRKLPFTISRDCPSELVTANALRIYTDIEITDYKAPVGQTKSREGEGQGAFAPPSAKPAQKAPKKQKPIKE